MREMSKSAISLVSLKSLISFVAITSPISWNGKVAMKSAAIQPLQKYFWAIFLGSLIL